MHWLLVLLMMLKMGMNLFIINDLNLRFSKFFSWLILFLNCLVKKLLILLLSWQMVEVRCSIRMNKSCLIWSKGLVRRLISFFLLCCDCLIETCIVNYMLVILYPLIKHQLSDLNILFNFSHFLLKTVWSDFKLILKALILIVFK